jgi:hypothetical protein
MMKIFSDPLGDKEKPAVGFGALASEGRWAIRIGKHPAEQRAPEKWFLERVKKYVLRSGEWR